MAHLRPHYQQLIDCLQLPPFPREGEVAWLEFQFPHNLTRAKMLKLREALLLTSALGLMEGMRPFWYGELAHTARLYEVETLPSHIDLRPYYQFDMPTVATQLDWDSSMCHLFGYEGLSESFEKQLQSLDTLNLVQMTVVEATEVTPSGIFIQFDFTAPPDLPLQDQVHYLQTVKKLVVEVKKHGAVAAHTHHRRPRFELESIGLSLERLSLTPESVQLIEEILASDVPVKRLVPPSKDASSPSNWRKPWASLLMTACGHPQATTKITHPVGDLEISVPTVSGVMFQALCSVVVHATMLKKLSIENTKHEATDTKWRWLLYALFSKASSTSVEIAGKQFSRLIPANGPVDAQSVINAAFPHTQLLMDSTALHDVDFGTVILGKGTEIHLSFDSSDTFVVEEEEGQTFQVIRDVASLDTLDILVPGYGHGVVNRSAVLQRQQGEEPPNSSSVKHIYLTDSEEDQNCVVLLPCIGARLESLRVFACGLGDEFLQLVFAICPNLKSIELAMLSLTTCHPITNALKAKKSQLTSIRMREWDVEDESSFAALLAMLGDLNSLAARRLKKFVINDRGSVDDTFKDASAKMLARVVHRNKCLKHVEAYMTPKVHRVYQKALAEIREEEDIKEDEDEDVGDRCVVVEAEDEDSIFA
ncbi:hypothetical protein Poli38472_011172 [Pythium oligandrum]|uniref:Uncharacterized protein n=1 Tax=Pythium oligandrum TaxID=41045 RepID=A0A8K1CPT3_PYTOL|nr:hypothetical protein Poli38472_011172 [Pythium oligandrum]|eukprot:TMW67552.1 hypothetical protein Poli38472_011172 [Pythium oligandrum]